MNAIADAPGRQLAEAELALLEMARTAAIAPVLAKRRAP